MYNFCLTPSSSHWHFPKKIDIEFFVTLNCFLLMYKCKCQIKKELVAEYTLNNLRFLWYSWKWVNIVIFELVPSVNERTGAWRIFAVEQKKMKNIFLRVHMLSGGGCPKITQWHLYGSLTVFQESYLDPCSTLEHQTCSTNQSPHDLLYGGDWFKLTVVVSSANLNGYYCFWVEFVI